MARMKKKIGSQRVGLGRGQGLRMASGRSPKNQGRGKDQKHGGKEEEEEEPGRNWKKKRMVVGIGAQVEKSRGSENFSG